MGRLRGLLWLIAGLVVAGLAGAIAFITLARATTQAASQPQATAKVPVVVAARAVTVRSALASEDLELKELPADSIPDGAVRKIEEARGKITTTDLFAGEVLLMQRLVDPNIPPTDGRMALIMSQDQVLMAFPAGDLLSKAGVLKPGDHVDLLFSFNFAAGGPGAADAKAAGDKKQQATFNVLQNLAIAAIVEGPAAAKGQTQRRAPESILLTVSPQDALVIKYLKDAGGIPDIVLRAPGADRTFTTDPVDEEYLVNRYRIPVGGVQ
jgi:pilus assembly protein CpaB